MNIGDNPNASGFGYGHHENRLDHHKMRRRLRQGHSRAIAESVGSHTVSTKGGHSEAVRGLVDFVSSRFCWEMVSNLTGTAKLIFSMSFSIALV